MSACLDCPMMDASRMPANWKPRLNCCMDDYRHPSNRMHPSGQYFSDMQKANTGNRASRRAEKARK